MTVRRHAASALVPLVLLAACGGSGSSGARSAAAPASAAPPSPAEVSATPSAADPLDILPQLQAVREALICDGSALVVAQPTNRQVRVSLAQDLYSTGLTYLQALSAAIANDPTAAQPIADWCASHDYPGKSLG